MNLPLFETLVPASAFAMGLLGSTHCVAMCGPVAGAFCAGLAPEHRGSTRSTAPFALGYNFGRLSSYAVAGTLVGALGAGTTQLLRVQSVRPVLLGLSGLVMVLAGLQLAGVFQSLSWLEKGGAKLWKHLRPLAQKLFPVRTVTQAYALGLLWGWMPCGMVYAALGMALSAGSAFGGAVTLTAFGLGTLPTMTALTLLASGFLGKLQQTSLKRGAGFTLAALGALSLLWALDPAALRARLGGPVAATTSQTAKPCPCHQNAH